MRELSLGAIRKWGKDTQLLQIQEELMELSVAISHFRRGRKDAKQEVIAELGDVILMIDQARCIFGEPELAQATNDACRKLAWHLGWEQHV